MKAMSENIGVKHTVTESSLNEPGFVLNRTTQTGWGNLRKSPKLLPKGRIGFQQILLSFSLVSIVSFLASCGDIPFPVDNKDKPAQSTPSLQSEPKPTPQPEQTPVVETKPSEIVSPSAETAHEAPKPIISEDVSAEKDVALGLMASGGDINRALFWLVNQNKPSAIALAKLKGANINSMNVDGDRPLCVAVEKGNDEAVKALLKMGVETDYVSSDFRTPLARAAFKGFGHIIKLLVDAGADVNFAPNGLLSPLHMAARNDQVEAIDALVSLNANVNLLVGGETPAHDAAEWEKPNALKALLDRGANAYLRNANGKTVFDIVESHKNSTMYERLKEVVLPYR